MKGINDVMYLCDDIRLNGARGIYLQVNEAIQQQDQSLYTKTWGWTVRSDKVEENWINNNSYNLCEKIPRPWHIRKYIGWYVKSDLGCQPLVKKCDISLYFKELAR